MSAILLRTAYILVKYSTKVTDLTPEERADLPMPLRRKRARTSTVAQKITYTCHHAGTYTSKHSDRVPEGKQRLNTKKSVKCGCTSRIVVNEMESGLVHVAYHWRHVGHGMYQFTAGKLLLIRGVAGNVED